MAGIRYLDRKRMVGTMKDSLWNRGMCMILSVIMLGMMVACGASSHLPEVPAADAAAEISVETVRELYTGISEALLPEEQSLYDNTVMVWLQDDLWRGRDLYETGHNLMIPMHYAFRSQNEEAITAFSSFFERFASDVLGEDQYEFQKVYTLNHMHFFYLCTQFMNLCAANGREELIPDGIAQLARNCAEEYLLHSNAIWGTEPTVIEHIRQILAGKEYPYKYYSGLVDPEQFALAILCDLRCLNTLLEKESDDVLLTAADLAYQLFESPLLNQQTEEGGWLFQVGVSSDDPDFAYAGNAEVYAGIQPRSRDDIAPDSSHFHRMPLFLRSFQSAQSTVETWELFTLRRRQLANQMMNYVLKNVNGYWLTTTFMDGTNGVYRYSYSVEGVGLSGYECSSTFLVGWWSMLMDGRITSVYQDTLDMLRAIPLKWDGANPYFNSTIVREQNPFFAADTAFESGMMEVLVLCASKIGPNE